MEQMGQHLIKLLFIAHACVTVQDCNLKREVRSLASDVESLIPLFTCTQRQSVRQVLVAVRHAIVMLSDGSGPSSHDIKADSS